MTMKAITMCTLGNL